MERDPVNIRMGYKLNQPWWIRAIESADVWAGSIVLMEEHTFRQHFSLLSSYFFFAKLTRTFSVVLCYYGQTFRNIIHHQKPLWVPLNKNQHLASRWHSYCLGVEPVCFYCSAAALIPADVGEPVCIGSSKSFHNEIRINFIIGQ